MDFFMAGGRIFKIDVESHISNSYRTWMESIITIPVRSMKQSI